MDEFQKRQNKYFCKECDKSYSQSQGLRNHTKIVHQGFKLKCNSCDKTFTQKRSLKSHKQIFHTEIEQKNDEEVYPDKTDQNETDQGKNSQNKSSQEEQVLDETNKSVETFSDDS